MKIQEGFVLREVCGERVIVGEGLKAVDFGKLLSVNETAAWLWREALRQGDFTVESLTKALCEEYDVEEAQALLDVKQLVAQWQKVGVIDNA